MSVTVDTTLCECGHPRHKHRTVDGAGPEFCTHIDPAPLQPEDIDIYTDDLICWCFEFREAERPAA